MTDPTAAYDALYRPLLWTAQVNDLVGGWIVTNYPHPLSEHDLRMDGDPRKRGYVIAECMTEADASELASSLNRTGYVPDALGPDGGRS